jgi:hypothetical protein
MYFFFRCRGLCNVHVLKMQTRSKSLLAQNTQNTQSKKSTPNQEKKSTKNKLSPKKKLKPIQRTATRTKTPKTNAKPTITRSKSETIDRSQQIDNKKSPSSPKNRSKSETTTITSQQIDNKKSPSPPKTRSESETTTITSQQIDNKKSPSPLKTRSKSESAKSTSPQKLPNKQNDDKDNKDNKEQLLALLDTDTKLKIKPLSPQRIKECQVCTDYPNIQTLFGPYYRKNVQNDKVLQEVLIEEMAKKNKTISALCVRLLVEPSSEEIKEGIVDHPFLKPGEAFWETTRWNYKCLSDWMSKSGFVSPITGPAPHYRTRKILVLEVDFTGTCNVLNKNYTTHNLRTLLRPIYGSSITHLKKEQLCPLFAKKIFEIFSKPKNELKKKWKLMFVDHKTYDTSTIGTDNPFEEKSIAKENVTNTELIMEALNILKIAKLVEVDDPHLASLDKLFADNEYNIIHLSHGKDINLTTRDINKIISLATELWPLVVKKIDELEKKQTVWQKLLNFKNNISFNKITKDVVSVGNEMIGNTLIIGVELFKLRLLVNLVQGNQLDFFERMSLLSGIRI